ncbi:MAG: MFS transporter [Candidatus Eremiobacteraeota bacterium]|nr:MFS transporter [Candidatus Eremiobacteraeota bacterium]
MPSRTPNSAKLGVFWFGIQLVWGALLGISLQARTQELHAATALASYGLIATAGAVVAAITQIATGPLADARRARGSNRIEFYIGGALVAAIAIVWFYSAASFAALVGAFLLIQFALNVAIGPYQAVIPDYIALERSGAASSWMAALQALGNAGGALIAAFVLNLRIAGGLIAGVLLASCAITIAQVRGLPLRVIAAEPLRIEAPFVDLLVSRALIYTGFYTLLGYLYFYLTSSLAESPAAAKTQSGIVLLLFTLASALGAALSGKPSDRLDKRAVVLGAGTLLIIALGILARGDYGAGLFVTTSVAGFAWGIFLTADWALGCSILPKSLLATTMGIWNLALIAPQIIAPALTTAVLTRIHALGGANAPRLAFVLALCEVALGVAWIFRIPKRLAGGVI